MNRKSFNIYITFLLGVLFVFSACKEEKTYPPLVLGTSTAPIASISHVADSLTESSTYITVGSNMDGNVYFVALESGTPAPGAIELVKGSTSPGSRSIAVSANSLELVKLKGLTPGVAYDLYSVATNNVEGKFGNVEGPVSFSTPDENAPVIVSMTPSYGSTTAPIDLSQIELVFDKAVELVDASYISVVDAFDESDLGIKGAVTVEGNVASIELTGEFDYLMEVAVIIEAGAFVDNFGNLSDAYYDDGAGAYSLYFQVADIIDLSVFAGAYHVVANEIGFGDGIKEYDVIIKPYVVPGSVYELEIQNFNNWSASVVYLSIDPAVDSCFMFDQPTGITYSGNGEDIMVRSDDVYEIASSGFKPGNFNRDGSEVNFFGQIYISLGSFGFYEFNITKIDGAAKIENTPTNFVEIPYRQFK